MIIEIICILGIIYIVGLALISLKSVWQRIPFIKKLID